jgi:glycyl-tRNA synthetase
MGATQPLGKTALFRSAHGPKNETYQRVLRASPIQAPNEARLAVIASGLAPENEIIAFQPVANALTSAVDEISRISLGKTEAADVDVKGILGYGHMLAYCTDSEVFLQRLPNTKGSTIDPPKRIYQCPEAADVKMPASRLPKFRALRILTPKHILVLQNRPQRAGANIFILAINKDDSQGYVTLYRRCPSSVKSAVGLDICPLTQSESGQKQYIIAIAGQDSSIEILTIDYISLSGFAKFKSYTHLKDVHSGPLTKITFSNYIGPPLPVSKDTPPQSVRLASVGVDNTVVVHTLRLRPHPATKTDKPAYVLIPPGSSEAAQTTFSVLVAILVATFSALLLQAFCEIRGAVPPTLGAPNWLSDNLKERFYVPYVERDPFNETKESEMKEALSSHISAIVDAPSQIPMADVIQAEEEGVMPSISTVTESISSLISENSNLQTPKAIVMRAANADDAEGSGEIIAELHDDITQATEAVDETVKRWEDLSEKQKRGWKAKLREAGHWVEEQGEGVLRGVLFGELAALAGG